MVALQKPSDPVSPEQAKLIVCMKWGTRYGSHYVDNLYNMVARNITPPFQLVCFTDDAERVDPRVDCRPLPGFPGVPEHLAVLPWRKISLWKRSLAPDLDGRAALVLDLDIVITGSLDPLFTFAPDRYAVIENWTKRGQNIGNTSVFRFTLGKHPEIYDEFIRDPDYVHKKLFRIEQEFISDTLHRQGEQVFWPKAWVRSFKQELIPIWPLRLFRPVPLPDQARIVVFHGKPDPDEAALGQWPASPWRGVRGQTTKEWPLEAQVRKIFRSFRPVSWIETHWR